MAKEIMKTPEKLCKTRIKLFRRHGLGLRGEKKPAVKGGFRALPTRGCGTFGVIKAASSHENGDESKQKDQDSTCDRDHDRNMFDDTFYRILGRV